MMTKCSLGPSRHAVTDSDILNYDLDFDSYSDTDRQVLEVGYQPSVSVVSCRCTAKLTH